ncbi:MAG: hypothetical protein MJ210_02210, partial [Alphaproteobacteria bacterium]|nr:hypothetical protein [Alphaproteobacteria bacterium]
MAMYWDPMWDDEEWLKNQSAATLRYIYTVAVSRGDKDDKKTMVAARLSQKLEETNKQEKGFKNENVSEADLLAYTQHMEDTENAGNTDNYDEYRKSIGETVDERLLEYTDTPWKNEDGSFSDKSLAYYVNQWKFAILAKASDLLGRTQPAEVQT